MCGIVLLPLSACPSLRPAFSFSFIRSRYTFSHYLFCQLKHNKEEDAEQNFAFVTKRYSPACTRLLSQYKTMLKLVGEDVPSIEEFMKRYRVRFFASSTNPRPYFLSVECGVKSHSVIDGPPCCITSIKSRRTCYRRTLERSRPRDWEMGCRDYAGTYNPMSPHVVMTT